MQSHLRAMLLVLSARFAMDDGDLVAAGRTAREAYVAAVSTKDLPILASTGVLAAELEIEHGRLESATEVLGAAARLRGADDETSLDIRAVTATLRGRLGDVRFAAAFDRGRALDRAAATLRLDTSGG